MDQKKGIHRPAVAATDSPSIFESGVVQLAVFAASKLNPTKYHHVPTYSDQPGYLG